MMTKQITFSTTALLGAVLAAPALSQDVIGGDDFQGGGVFTSRVFSPDNTATNGMFAGGSFFDRFGIVDPSNPADVPFDFLDDSTTFPADTLGIFNSTDRDPFLGFADLENPQNPAGTVSLDYTFDIAGFSNLNLALDFGAVGNFADDETVTIQASIDGGPVQTLFDGRGTADASTYTLALESGTVIDRYTNPFFSELTWLELVEFGPAGALDFAASDADMDGFNDDTGERTFTSGAFTNDERIVFDQQFSVNGVGLNNVLQTLDADILGSGSELSITLSAAQNGGFQIIGIDDLVLTGEEGSVEELIGDFNSDGFVAQADLDLVLLNFGSSELPDGFNDSNTTDGAFDGQIGQNDLDDVLLNFGGSAAPNFSANPSVIPEPTSLALLGLGGVALAARRRRRA